MPRYKLRTLLILLAVLPPLLWFGWTKYEAWRAEQERQTEMRRVQAVQVPLIIGVIETTYLSDLQFGTNAESLPRPEDGLLTPE